MWADAEAWLAAHRATLAAAGMPVRAVLRPATGLLCGYSDGIIHLALPDRETETGRMQALITAGLMGISPGEVSWLFHALLPRLVAHELGHALRAEAGLLGRDRCREEQIAEELAAVLGHPPLPPVDRCRALALLAASIRTCGGLEVAAALHRRGPELARRLALAPVGDDAVAAARRHLQTHYSGDIAAYTRLAVAWAYLDLACENEESLDGFRTVHLSLAG